jgi:hypothetical protein
VANEECKRVEREGPQLDIDTRSPQRAPPGVEFERVEPERRRSGDFF